MESMGTMGGDTKERVTVAGCGELDEALEARPRPRVD
jgi:hypothetical protein